MMEHDNEHGSIIAQYITRVDTYTHTEMTRQGPQNDQDMETHLPSDGHHYL